MLLKEGNIKRVHVNQFAIRRKEDQPLRVKTSKDNIPANTVQINGPAAVVYRPDKPLSCGARAWVETRAEIEIE